VRKCDFQLTVAPFDGILRDRDLSLVFCGERDLSVLQNQFSLLALALLPGGPLCIVTVEHTLSVAKYKVLEGSNS
jgi:hypothetical protein